MESISESRKQKEDSGETVAKTTRYSTLSITAETGSTRGAQGAAAKQEVQRKDNEEEVYETSSPEGAATTEPITPSSHDGTAEDNEQSRKNGSTRLPARAVSILKRWVFSPEHVDYPYPNRSEKKRLAEEANITLKQLNNFMANVRKRLWGPYWKKKRTIEDGRDSDEPLSSRKGRRIEIHSTSTSPDDTDKQRQSEGALALSSLKHSGSWTVQQPQRPVSAPAVHTPYATGAYSYGKGYSGTVPTVSNTSMWNQRGYPPAWQQHYTGSEFGGGSTAPVVYHGAPRTARYNTVDTASAAPATVYYRACEPAGYSISNSGSAATAYHYNLSPIQPVPANVHCPPPQPSYYPHPMQNYPPQMVKSYASHQRIGFPGYHQ